MRKFDYRLEKALEVREIRRLLAEESLAQALRAENLSRAELGYVQDKRDGCHQDIRTGRKGRIDAKGMRHLIMLEESLTGDIVNQQDDLARKEAVTRAATQDVVARYQDERTLQRHREKAWDEFMSAYWWEQNKVLDEMGQARHVRRQRG